MKVLHAATEAFPYVKVGGLGDVLGALPASLRALGVDARLLLPGFPGVIEGVPGLAPCRSLSGLPGVGNARLLSGETDRKVPLYVLDAPGLYARSRNPYADFGDSHLCAAALCRAAALIVAEGDGQKWRPDIMHCHDWQTALTPAYLSYSGVPTPSVMTIHNLAYQGLYAPDILPAIGLPRAAYHPGGVEFWGRVNFLKAGLVHATHLTTVSPRYAQEIQLPEGGHGLDGVLGARREELSGILNGIDEAVWDPSTSPHLAAPFDVRRLDQRKANKAALQAELGLEGDPEAPLFGIVSRLNAHKGMDLVVSSVEHLVGLGAELVVIGTGEHELEHAFAAAAARHPGRVGYFGGQSEARAHRVFAGADFILVPSRSEPCGLVQMYAMRYGAMPLVRYTGGLADTVRDETTGPGATGFTFDIPTGHALGDAISRAVGVYSARPSRVRELQVSGMRRDSGWAASARAYTELYRLLVQ